MEKKYIIYLHRNKINGKCYVGQTCQPTSCRWGHDGWHYHEQSLFYRAIQKYGWDNFEHLILEENLSAEEANERECYWGGYYHALAPEGYCLQLGKNNYKTSSINNSINKSETSKENWKDETYRQHVIEGRKKMWQHSSPDLKEKMLNNLDRSGLGGLARSKQVECIESGIIYQSTREAERITGINHCNISQVCNGKRKTAGGFHWRYKE